MPSCVLVNTHPHLPLPFLTPHHLVYLTPSSLAFPPHNNNEKKRRSITGWCTWLCRACGPCQACASSASTPPKSPLTPPSSSSTAALVRPERVLSVLSLSLCVVLERSRSFSRVLARLHALVLRLSLLSLFLAFPIACPLAWEVVLGWIGDRVCRVCTGLGRRCAQAWEEGALT